MRGRCNPLLGLHTERLRRATAYRLVFLVQTRLHYVISGNYTFADWAGSMPGPLLSALRSWHALLPTASTRQAPKERARTKSLFRVSVVPAITERGPANRFSRYSPENSRLTTGALSSSADDTTYPGGATTRRPGHGLYLSLTPQSHFSLFLNIAFGHPQIFPAYNPTLLNIDNHHHADRLPAAGPRPLPPD